LALRLAFIHIRELSRSTQETVMSQQPLATNAATVSTVTLADFHLSFRSLFQIGRGFSFPCDASGRVDMAGLSQRARDNYLFARAMVGRELQPPAVEEGVGAARATRDCTVYPRQHASVWAM
jgi:DNA-binding IclR family transcriptional regulator